MQVIDQILFHFFSLQKQLEGLIPSPAAAWETARSRSWQLQANTARAQREHQGESPRWDLKMQSARRAAGKCEVSQLISAHASPPPSATTASSPLVAAFHTAVAAAFPRQQRLTAGTSHCSSSQWQPLEIDISVRNGQFGQFDADHHIIVGLIVAAHSHIAFQRLDEVAQHAESQIHVAVVDRLENDTSHRSQALHQRWAH